MRIIYVGNLMLYILSVLLFACSTICNETASAESDKFTEKLTEEVYNAKIQDTSVVKGGKGWLFFVPELRHLLAGKFWGDEAKKVSVVTNPEFADPLPAILDFKTQLDKAGIELIFVPIPAKVTIYPEMISENTKTIRTDKHHISFYEILRGHGVNVLDLTDLFLKNRYKDAGELFCKQDTHWSGQGCVLAAEAIAKIIGIPPWMADIPKRQSKIETQTVKITGDLWEALGKKDLEKEQIILSFVKAAEESNDSTQQFGASWRESPVVLLGDSHNLVFHGGGDMHATGAGLADHLAHHFGFAVDVVAVRGSGATPSRLNLFRRRDNLKGKRVIVWCLSVREFTQGQGWRKVPIIK